MDWDDGARRRGDVLKNRIFHWLAGQVANTGNHHGVPLVYFEGVRLPVLREALDLFRCDEESFDRLRDSGLPILAMDHYPRPGAHGVYYKDLVVCCYVREVDTAEDVAFVIAHEVGHLRLHEAGLSSREHAEWHERGAVQQEVLLALAIAESRGADVDGLSRCLDHALARGNDKLATRWWEKRINRAQFIAWVLKEHWSR